MALTVFGTTVTGKLETAFINILNTPSGRDIYEN